MAQLLHHLVPPMTEPAEFLKLHTANSFDPDQFGRNTCYGLWPDLTLAWVNDCWQSFASKNGAHSGFRAQWGVGRSVLSGIAEPLQPFFEQNYRQCLEADRPWLHQYECSSPTKYRLFCQTAYPLSGKGLLVVHSLRIERPHHRAESQPIDLYYMKDGVIRMCAHCRRVARANADIWDWVPDWLAAPPKNTSHGLCQVCEAYYYGPKRIELAEFPEAIETSSADEREMTVA